MIFTGILQNIILQFGQVLYRNFLLLVAKRLLFYAEGIVFPYDTNDSSYMTCPACEHKMLIKTFKRVQHDKTCPHCGYKFTSSKNDRKTRTGN
jgi:DNA-directed RNA polymerase subunit RPC12/RpoP